MRILFLSAWYPFPPNNGSKLRIFNLLRGLVQYHGLTLITFADEPQDELSPPPQAWGVDVRIVPNRLYNPTSARALLGLLSPTPRYLVDTYQPSMAKEIQRELNRRSYDLVIASQWRMAAYVSAFSGLPAIFEELELGAFETKRAKALTPFHRLRHSLPLIKLRHYLRGLLPHFGACTVVSEEEGAILQHLVPNYQNSIHVIPNCVNLADYADVQEIPQPKTLIFTGSFRYSTNHDAMVWFLNEIYPLIQDQVPGTRLTVTGDHAGLPLPAADGVTLTGHLDDVRSLVASSWECLVPIRHGGGTRLKILEAMALRTPVVATSKGAEGLDLRDGEQILIADTPETFAEAVIRLLREPGLRARLADNAFRFLSEKYDWAVVMPRFLDLVKQVTSGPAVA